MIQKISQYFNGVQIEMKKVTWLDKQEMFGSTVIVGIFTVLIAFFLFFVDFSLSELVSIWIALSFAVIVLFSINALSIFLPYKAAIKCSIVDTLTPISFETVVHKVVLVTLNILGMI